MRKSIFFKLALLIIPITIIFNGAALFISYRVTYSDQISHFSETIKRVAASASYYLVMNYPLTYEEKMDTCSSFSALCSTADVTYVFAVEPDIENNSETYIAIGFGHDASEEAMETRSPGVVVKGALTQQQIDVYNDDTSIQVCHESNQFGETLICYMLVATYVDKETNQLVDLDKPILVGVEENLSVVVNSIQSQFRQIAITIIMLTVMIQITFFLILYFRVSKPLKRISNRMASFGSDREKGFEALPVKGKDELAEMSRAFNSMVQEIDTYIRDIDELNKEKHMQYAELEIAHGIQTGLLKPERYRTKDASINARMLTAKNVGGDLYDYLVLDDGTVYLMIADVSGKGISAAMFMSRAITLLHQYAELGYSPAQMLSAYNDTLAGQNPNVFFITTFVAVYHPDTRELRYSNAGHNHPYLLSDTLTELDGAIGMAAGIFKESYEEASVTLREGDVVFLYTDGVNESENTDGEFFGTDALEEELRRHIGGDTERLVDDVMEKLAAFSDGADQSDDITVLSMKVEPVSIHRELNVKAEVENLTAVTQMITKEEILREDTVSALCLIAEEIFVNICYYAYPEKDGEAKIVLDICPESAMLTFIDSGEPFDPTHEVIGIEEYDHENSLGGLGRFLSFSVADDFSYSRENGKNILKVIKNDP